jgi:hypothetical protein
MAPLFRRNAAGLEAFNSQLARFREHAAADPQSAASRIWAHLQHEGIARMPHAKPRPQNSAAARMYPNLAANESAARTPKPRARAKTRAGRIYGSEE